jgi:hypothetical protein
MFLPELVNSHTICYSVYMTFAGSNNNCTIPASENIDTDQRFMNTYIHSLICSFCNFSEILSKKTPLSLKNKKNAKISIFISFQLNFQQLLVLLTEETEVHVLNE